MVTAQTALPLGYFYPQTEGSERLSQNLASNELFTPLQSGRITVGSSSFERYRDNLDKQPRLPWGRARDYGGLQKVQLPEEFIKLKTHPPDVVQKGHRHYGSGSGDPRDLAEQQFYDVTNLKKSKVRSNDQLLPGAASKEMNERQIDLPFPAEHPYYSHIPRMALLPKFNSPDDPISGDPHRSDSPLHPNTPSIPYRVLLVSKTKGASYRREIQEFPFEGKKLALTWNGENDFYQLMKSPDGGVQPYYPTPPKLVSPNLRLREESQILELRTANSLRNVERDQWKTIYQYNYTGYGKSNAMHLDDYHKKAVSELTEDRDPRDDELVPKSVPIFTLPRPVEGRYARLYQGRKNISASIRYLDENQASDPPDVIDLRPYSSLPGKCPRSRTKDEWCKTKPAAANNAYPLEVNVANRHSPQKNDKHDEQAEWKTYQLPQTPAHGLNTIFMKRVSAPDAMTDAALDKLPKSVEDQERKAEASQKYLREYGEERDRQFKEIDRLRELQKLELQYLSEHDMYALRNKTDQMGNRAEPKALDQHAIQVLSDESRIHNLLNRTKQNAAPFETGLKFSSEKISNTGLVTDIHDRQLKGYNDRWTTWQTDIPKTTSPPQNHGSAIASFVNRSNPFSLSLDSAREPGTVRTEEGDMRRTASTGSILKTPGSPPRIETGRSISFNEVVRVVSSEYGDKFRTTTSPLSRTEDGNLTTKRKLNLGRRTPTPLPSPMRHRREPSIHTNISPRGPVLRSTSAFPHREAAPKILRSWNWNYDHRSRAEFDPESWKPRPNTAMPQTSLLDLQDNWTKAGAHRRFYESFPEKAPDFRDSTRLYEFCDKSADLQFTRSAAHREKRHQFYGYNSHHFYNGNLII